MLHDITNTLTKEKYMNELVSIDTNNYAAMAKAMGMLSDSSPDSERKSSSLARFKINHSPVMGQEEIKGKMVNVEKIEGGAYKLEIPEGKTYYSTTANIRPFLQRYMYKRFVKGSDANPNRFIKTIMHDDLNIDLKDNDGGYNCGKPAGYIKDFKALGEDTQNLIRQIKRVRVILGTVTFQDAMDSNGDPAELGATPFIWEIDNRDAFKTLGGCFTQLAKLKRLPVQHSIQAATEERKLPNGNSFYVPSVTLDVSNTIELSQADQQSFTDFMNWVQNYNDYIIKKWDEKSRTKEDVDEDMVENLVNLDSEEHFE